MRVNVLKEDKNTLIIEVKGESETFLNMICEELWNIKGVEEAAFYREHPFLEEPKLFIKTKGISPRKALKEALKNLKQKLKSLKEIYTKTIR